MAEKSFRLTKTEKDGIITKMMKRWDEKHPVNDLRKEIVDLAQKVYDDVYSKEARDWMETAPLGALPGATYLNVRISDSYHDYFMLPFDGSISLSGNTTSAGSFEKKVYHDHSSKGWRSYTIRLSSLTDQDGVKKAIEKIRSVLSKRAEKRKEALTAIKGNLSKFNTTKQIMDAWPEVTPFLPKYTQPEAKTAIVIATKDLNNMFDLPVEEKAA